MYTEQFTEVHDVLGALAPTTANGTVGIHRIGYVSMADYHRAFVWLHVGTPAAGISTIDVVIGQATDAAGTGAKVITGKGTVAQLVAADAGVYVGVEIRSEELDVTNGYCFIDVLVIVGSAAYTYECAVFGIVSRYEPVGVTDFQQIVA